MESMHLNTSRSFNLAQFGSERRVKDDRPPETDPYQILSTGSKRRNRFDPKANQSASLLLKREGMTRVTFNNGQKVYRKSIITPKPKPTQKIREISPILPTLENKSASQKRTTSAPMESPKKSSAKRLSVVDTPKKAIMVGASEKRVSVNQLLTEEKTEELDIHQDLQTRALNLKIKETISVRGSEEASEGDSSIIMKSDLTEEPLSRSLSPIRSRSGRVTKSSTFKRGPRANYERGETPGRIGTLTKAPLKCSAGPGCVRSDPSGVCPIGLKVSKPGSVASPQPVI